MSGLAGPVSADAMLLAIGVVTGLATACGGLFTLAFHARLALFRCFSAGAVLGVALFDLAPESMELGRGVHAPSTLAAFIGLGFGLYALADAWAASSRNSRRGDLGPASLTLHSLTDGLGIGLAFQVSAVAGGIVAAAVLAHDIVDGANTVTLSLAGGATAKAARRWLTADAIAPLVGILISRFIAAPRASLAIWLALFAGFFLFIGAGHARAENAGERSALTGASAMLLGMAFIYGVVRLAG